MVQQHLVIMVKAPKAGRVKTRLGREIGSVAATSFYRRTCFTILHRLGPDPRWQTHLAISPNSELNNPFWQHIQSANSHVKKSPQGEGDLGKRMQNQFNNLTTCRKKLSPSRQPAHIEKGPVLIIGTDIPAITPNHIAAAFKKLRQKSAILGPSGDGGYWLVGQNTIPKPLNLFQNIRWSTEHTFKDTMRNLPASSWAVAETLSDVDNKAEYQAFHHLSRTVIPPRQIRELTVREYK